MTDQNRLEYALFILRLTVFVVMAVWTLDKFVNPDHAAAVYEHFYFISNDIARPLMALIGIAESVLILAFLAGLHKRITYGLVLVIHGISTLSSWEKYLAPFDNLLFFAAWPMLGACIALYLLREQDNKFTVKLKRDS